MAAASGLPARVRAHPAFPGSGDVRALLRLSGPIVVVQVGMMAMGLVATILAGHYSDAALGGVALGNLYTILFVLLGWGALLALDPIAAQAVGAGDADGLALGVQRGLVLATGLAAFAMLCCLPVRQVLAALGQPAPVIPLASDYVFASLPGTIPFLVFVVLRQALQAMGRTREIVWVIAAANALHLVLCWALMFGRLGSPALGVAGAGIAATVTRFGMAIGLAALAWPRLRPALLPPRAGVLDRRALGHMLRIGLPIGLQQQLEYGIFAVVGVLMGRLGTRWIDAHQVALTVASATFMVPQGVGAAAAVLVGQALGARDVARARRSAVASLAAGGGFMLLAGLALWLAPRPIAALFSTDAGVVGATALLLPVAAAFQVFDGLQVVSIGILRGLGDTRTPLVVNVVGFWVVGLPVTLLLGFGLGGGATGLWGGLAAGMGVVALVLLARVRIRMRRPPVPLRIRAAAG